MGIRDEDSELRVWFRDEIRNALLAVLRSQIMALDLNSAGAAEYRNGVLATIMAVATVFGIDLGEYIQPLCGHSRQAIRGDVEGTSYCGDCVQKK
jgi:hypothetical protein